MKGSTPSQDVELERRVFAVAQEISQAGSRRSAVSAFILDKMLDVAMSSASFKTQLFRFVDVFPQTTDDTDVQRHVDEYFTDTGAPRLFDLARRVSHHLPGSDRLTTLVARAAIKRMAKQFIAGSSATDAAPRLRELWEAGEACTVDVLGEKTVTADEADRYALRVRETLEELSRVSSLWPSRPLLERDPWGELGRVNISVKPTALSPRFSAMTEQEGIEEVVNRSRATLERAKALGATVHVDMESYDVKESTLALLRRIGSEFGDGPRLGVVVQAYLKDAYEDLAALADWSRDTLAEPLQVRLVKGAYWDAETIEASQEGWVVPVFTSKGSTDANFERCTQLLIDRAGDVRPIIASHNLRSISVAIAYAASVGLPMSAIEFQLLYGMAEPVHVGLRNLSYRVRTYAPVGELVPGMAYLVRRLLENTANESFVRQRFGEGKGLRELMRPPVPDVGIESREPGHTTSVDGPGPFANEPPSEFRRPEIREAMADAIVAAPDTFPLHAPLVIGGDTVGTDREIISVDPGSPARIVCRSARACAADVERAIEAARTALPAWRDAPVEARARVLFDAAAVMRRRRAKLASLICFEAGKPWNDADADVAEAIDFCEYYGRQALALRDRSPLLSPAGETNSYRYRARGIGAVIAPWNFPLAIPAGMVTAALVTGNCVLFKPAEQTPGVGSCLVDVLLEAGTPAGALAFLPGLGEEVGAALVAHKDVTFVAFTGSRAVGLQIIEQAAIHRDGQRHVKHVVAEMGGKNAVIVDTDADLDVAVPAIVKSAFAYAGQKCSAASRLIGIGPMFDELVERVVGAAQVLPVGHASEQRTVVGPLIDEDAFARVRGYVELAATEGDVVLARTDVPSRGWFVGPTVVIVDDPAKRVATEEVFGPLLTCIKADDFDHALALANDTDYALTGAVFSRSPHRINEAARRFDVGNLYINRGTTGALVGRQPFGGHRLSGVGGKAGGPDYLLQFVEPGVVTENTVRQGFAPSPERPPRSPDSPRDQRG